MLDEGKSVTAVARELDLVASALGQWVKHAAGGSLKGAHGADDRRARAVGAAPQRESGSPGRAGQGITCSLSRGGDCYDNAVMESFFATMKKEEAERFPRDSNAKMALFDYIECSLTNVADIRRSVRSVRPPSNDAPPQPRSRRGVRRQPHAIDRRSCDRRRTPVHCLRPTMTLSENAVVNLSTESDQVHAARCDGWRSADGHRRLLIASDLDGAGREDRDSLRDRVLTGRVVALPFQ